MSIPRRQFLSTLIAAGAAPALAHGVGQTSRSVLAQSPRPQPSATAGQQRGSAAAQAAAAYATAAAQRGDPWIEINTANLIWNLRQIEQRAQKPVMAVVKANGYGHGLVPVAQALEKAGVKYFLVGKLDEARALRAAGVRGSILNFGPFVEADAEEIVRSRITQNVYDDRVHVLRRAAQRLGVGARVQIKIDTGLGRFGIPYDRVGDFLDRVAYLPSVGVEGAFTTLTEDPEFDAVQLARFKEVTERTRRWGHDPVLRSAASSAAICDFPAACAELDLVRPGIMLYGLYPSTRAAEERKLDLRPVLALKARVAQVKTLRPGESVGYHRAYTAAVEERVAIMAAGYSDGVPRAIADAPAAPSTFSFPTSPTSRTSSSSFPGVLINGRRCQVIAISSNAVIARLPHESGPSPTAHEDRPGGLSYRGGDEAVFIGVQGPEAITADDLAQATGRNVYNLVMELSGLLPRIPM